MPAVIAGFASFEQAKSRSTASDRLKVNPKDSRDRRFFSRQGIVGFSPRASYTRFQFNGPNQVEYSLWWQNRRLGR